MVFNKPEQLKKVLMAPLLQHQQQQRQQVETPHKQPDKTKADRSKAKARAASLIFLTPTLLQWTA
jgi:hypothetical protein